DEVEPRSEHFRTRGWPCLVVWESEVEEDLDRVISRVESFQKGVGG
ncbi:hypothetical protein LCGC14_2608070, partial [marine sediment metagenome]